jgi:2-polyprenyl-3-methyl-5-hydroxy-6-metoxy-1,4-benzoquinol methylase
MEMLNRTDSDKVQCASVDDALRRLSSIVEAQNGGDLAYFVGQQARYRHTMERIVELFPKRCRILDIGSHYLHQAGLLALLGYEVWGVDLPLFADAAFVKQRADMLGVRNCTTESLESGTFLEAHDGKFDLVVFTEIIEHITFNPVAYWARVYKLLDERGSIYLTTPNALRPSAFVSAAMRLFSFGGIGISVPSIFSNVTYGHHWKEYSASELRQYFKLLSPDFDVTIETYSLLPESKVKRIILQALGTFPAFRSDIEAVVRIAGKTGFVATPPRLAMARD